MYLRQGRELKQWESGTPHMGPGAPWRHHLIRWEVSSVCECIEGAPAYRILKVWELTSEAW